MFWALNYYVGDAWRGMRLLWHVSCMGKDRNVYRIWFGNLTLGDHLEYLGVDETIILKWILRKWDGRLWMIQCSHSNADESVLGYDMIGFIQLRIWRSGGL